MLNEQKISLEYQMRLSTIINLCLLGLLCSINALGAGIDWSIATTSFPSDHSIGDTGHEKTPYGYVDLITGNLIFDIPEITLKGDRGLDFTLSRSYGKVNNGFRTIGNWELESPRLVMMTGPSTKLQGDVNGTGICSANGDASNGTNGGRPDFSTQLLETPYKNKIVKTYIDQAKVDLANYLLKSTESIANRFGVETRDDNLNFNKQAVAAGLANLSQKAYAAMNSNIQQVDISLTEATTEKEKFRKSIVDSMNSAANQATFYLDGQTVTGSTIISRLETYSASNNYKLTAKTKGSTSQVAVDITASVIDSTIKGYLYFNMIEKLKSNNFSNISGTKQLPLSTTVDTRKRPISLYLPAQKNRVFYPVNGDAAAKGYPANAKYISQDNWFISCSDSGKDFTVRSPNGMVYIFPEANRENQTGYPSLFGSQFVPGRVSVYASSIENQYGESYKLTYLNKVNTALVYEQYNYTNKLFLKTVRHQLDNSDVATSNDLQLTYVKNDGTSTETTEKDFDNISGDIVLSSIDRLINGTLKSWVKYTYKGTQSVPNDYKSADSLITGGTIGEFQDSQAATLYLSSAGYISGDAVTYTYGGPYRIIGSVMPQKNGITKQDFIWYYSDLTRAIFYKTSAKNELVETASTVWDYSLNSLARPGFDESKSYRVSTSLRTPANANSYQVTYSYEARIAGENGTVTNEQKTKVVSKDVATSKEKTYEYTYYSFVKGAAEDYRHGLLKKLKVGDREETYEWSTPSIFGLEPIISNDNSTEYKNVSYVRMNKKTVSHHGTYSTELSDFDTYGNAKTIKHTGLNGSTAVSRTTALDYFNADPANSDVQNSSLPWLVGLVKSSINGNYTNFTTTFDSYGAIATDTRNGATTTYKYQTVSFSTCLGELTSFEWSKFMSCIGSYVAGNKHNGLVIEKNIGNGQLITYYSDYSKGIPLKVQNPNNSTETNSVNDFGDITEHKDADGVVSIKVYDDAGRLKEDKPVSGLSYSTISYDGLSVTTTANNGGDIISVTQYDGDGQVISTQTTTGGKSIYQTKSYDAFGNATFESYPSSSEKPTVGISYGYDDFNRQTSINDNGSTSTYCYQNCGGASGAISTTTNDDGVITNQYYALGDFDLSLLANSIQKGNDGTQLVSTVTYDSSLLKPTTSVLGNSKQTYTYLANGLLSTSYDHNSANEARKLTYSYDAAGRVKTLVHPDNTTEAFYYTTKIGDLISSRTWNNATASYDYTKAGRLKSSTSLDTSLVFELDSYGRTKSLNQTISAAPAKSYKVDYSYNNLSQVTSITYPNGKTIDLSNQNSFGEVSKIPSVIQAVGYNEWHQPTTITANDNVIWDIGYDVDGKPNSINYNAFGQCQLKLGYGYDTLKRIKTISDQCSGSNQYNASLERYGTGYLKKATLSQGIYTYAYNSGDIDAVNITSQQPDVINKFYQYTYYPNTSKLKSVSWSGYSQIDYDDLNRVTNDGVRQFTYDAFGRMKTAGSDQYLYAPDNLRVRATRDGSVTDYIYGLDGELLSEINLSNNLHKNYVYIAGQMAATLESFPDTDTDRDEVSDVEELEYGLNPFFPDAITDSDNDGLPDYLEKFLGLNPNNADTDGDGFSDGYEYNTLGLGAALNKDLKPTEPEPPRDDYAWMMPIINLILNDE